MTAMTTVLSPWTLLDLSLRRISVPTARLIPQPMVAAPLLRRVPMTYVPTLHCCVSPAHQAHMTLLFSAVWTSTTWLQSLPSLG
jgi:hypothetical protein